MGYVTVMGTCFGCGVVFGFNAERVPSYQGEPICESCITVVNHRRREAGLPQWPVLEGAYEPQEVAW